MTACVSAKIAMSIRRVFVVCKGWWDVVETASWLLSTFPSLSLKFIPLLLGNSGGRLSRCQARKRTCPIRCLCEQSVIIVHHYQRGHFPAGKASACELICKIGLYVKSLSPCQKRSDNSVGFYKELELAMTI